MTLKFDTLDLYRSKFEELDFYLLEYEGFIEENGAPYCDFMVCRPKNEYKINDIFIRGVKRMVNILNSYSRKIEFGDILKRVQETIRKDRAKEKQLKKRKFDEDNKQVSQIQINAKMIMELKSDMKRMNEIIDNQLEMFKYYKTLEAERQPQGNRDTYSDNDVNLEESRISLQYNGQHKSSDSRRKHNESYSNYGTQLCPPDYTNQWE